MRHQHGAKTFMNMGDFADYSLLMAAAASSLLCLLMIPVARALGLMDQPDERKVHRQPTALVGGIAIFVVFFVFLMHYVGYFNAAAALPAPSGVDGSVVGWPPGALLCAAAVVLITGLVDDRWPLSAWIRFVAQGLACVVMIYWGGVFLTDFGQLFWSGNLYLGVLAVPITIFSALGVINAFNMIDGLDGLSGTIFLIASLAMATLAWLAGQVAMTHVLLILSACAFGFLLLNARLPWNKRARVFLGDSGSVFLGFMLAWMFIDLGNGEDRAFAPITAVWIFAIPLLDTSRLMRNRWKRGTSAFRADQNHLHHAFLRAGFTVGQAWWGIVALCAFTAAVAITLELAQVPEYLRFYGFIIFGLVYFAFMKRAWARGRFLGRVLNGSIHTDSG